ncbi:MAG: hypothetical protein M3282_02775 [Gemmatimonadota bacterium]|nr:hypothetical protein [Gemmatimonadota bacterium]
MHVCSRPIFSLAALSVLGCSGDRATGPTQDEADRAAAEFERVAAELGVAAGPGFAAGPTTALTYNSAAAALRGGARVTRVDIAVGGATETWSAFGHEIQFELPPGSTTQGLTAPPPLRAFLAWRPSPSGLRVIHLLSVEESGPIGRIFPATLGNEVTSMVPSFLMYAESRDALWQAVSGAQTSRLVSTGAACPAPPLRAPTSLPPPSCVEATFTFGFSNAQAQPFALRLGPGAPPTVSGTRTLSMATQAVRGVKLKVTLIPFAFPPIAGRALP